MPPHFSGIDDTFLWGAALASEKTADGLGIETERGRARCAYVMMLSDGRAAEIEQVRGFIRDGGASPEAQVGALVERTARVRRLPSRRGAWGGGLTLARPAWLS